MCALIKWGKYPLTLQSPVVREQAQFPDDRVIMSCIAKGYPLDDFSANDVVSKPQPVDEVINFIGFE
jgi:hypothetical protein